MPSMPEHSGDRAAGRSWRDPARRPDGRRDGRTSDAPGAEERAGTRSGPGSRDAGPRRVADPGALPGPVHPGRRVLSREGKADPRRCTLAFARAATRRGARIRSGVRVQSLRRNGHGWRVGIDDGASIQAGAVVLAAGIWSGRIAQMAGVTLPVSAVGLTMAATARTAPFIKHLVQHAGRRLSMKQTQEGNVLIGGGWPAALAQTDGVVDRRVSPNCCCRPWRAA